MAFINEKIPEDFLKSFDFSVFTRFDGKTPLIVYPSISTWTRDEDRDAFLIATDAGGGHMLERLDRSNSGFGGRVM